MSKWKDNSFNKVLESKDGFYISYNPNLLNGAETALVAEGQTGFYILMGDHRKEYEKIIDQGWDECFRYFESKPDLKAFWSN